VNSAFIGFPIAKAVFSDDIFYLVVIANVMLNIYLFSICIWQLNYGDERKITIKSIFKPLLNILSIVTFISVFMLFANIKLPDYPFQIIETLGDATIPLSMIVVGVQLGSSDFRGVFRNYQLIYASLCNVLLIPALTLLVMYNMPVSDNVKLAITLSSIFPCAVLTVALAHREGKNTNLIAEGVALTTLFTMVTIPAWLIVLVKLFT
jgi:predicted permease